MGERVGRRGFLRMVAGAVAGAVVATQVVEHVAAEDDWEATCEPIETGVNEQGLVTRVPGPVTYRNMNTGTSYRTVGAIQLTHLPVTSNPSGPDNWFASQFGSLPSHTHPLPPFMLSQPAGDSHEWAYHLAPASDEPKLAYGLDNVALLSRNIGLTTDQVMEGFTAEEVDVCASMLRESLRGNAYRIPDINGHLH